MELAQQFFSTGFGFAGNQPGLELPYLIGEQGHIPPGAERGDTEVAEMFYYF
jgi:hypothetical protein